MKNLKKLAIALAVMGSCSAMSAHAQSTPYNPSWYVAPSLNMMDPDSDFGVDKNGTGAGLRFGKPLSQSWDLQFGTTYARSRDNGSRYQQNTLGADALFMLSRQSFRPFLLVGTGIERDKVNTPLGEAVKNSPYVSAGVGAQFLFNDQWSMQADVRRVHGFIHDDAFGMKHSDNNYVTVGLNYAFDKPAPVAVTRAPEPVAFVAPTPAPAPAPTPAPAPAPRFEKVTFSATELFAFDSAELRMPQPKLDDIASALNSNKEINNVVVTGYTDRIGSDKYNMKLSKHRAQSVTAYLASKGIDAGRLTAAGKGEANPIVECHQKKQAELITCLEPNRRVEVDQITIERRVQ